jgi:hypothetical protein
VLVIALKAYGKKQTIGKLTFVLMEKERTSGVLQLSKKPPKHTTERPANTMGNSPVSIFPLRANGDAWFNNLQTPAGGFLRGGGLFRGRR